MNAASRLFNQGILSRAWVISIFFTRYQFILCVLIFSLLVSALGVVYITNAIRSMHAAIEQTVIEKNQLQLQWRQLLLEKSTGFMESPIQHMAENQLDMMIPEGKSIEVITMEKSQ